MEVLPWSVLKLAETLSYIVWKAKAMSIDTNNKTQTFGHEHLEITDLPRAVATWLKKTNEDDIFCVDDS